MPDQLDTQAVDHHTVTDGDLAALQTAALRELIELCGPARTAEAQFEHDAGQAKDRTDTQFQASSQRIEQRFQQLRGSLEQRYQEQVGLIRSRSESDADKLQSNTLSVRERVAIETRTAIRDSSKRLDHDVWLAESSAEATAEQLVRERERLEGQVSAMRARLDEMEERSQWLLQIYRQKNAAEFLPGPDEASLSDKLLEVFEHRCESALQDLSALEALKLPRMFIGAWPYVSLILFCAAVVGCTAWLTFVQFPGQISFAVTGPISFLGALLIALGVGQVCWRLARSYVKAVYVPLDHSLIIARRAIDRYARRAIGGLGRRQKQAQEQMEREVESARELFKSSKSEIEQRRASSLNKVEESSTWLSQEIQERSHADLERAEQGKRQCLPDLQRRYDHYQELARQRHQRELEECRRREQAERSALESRWIQGLACIDAMIDHTERLKPRLFREWNEPLWKNWTPPREFTSVARFGRLDLDFAQLARGVRGLARFDAEPTSTITIPALLGFPGRGSLLLETVDQGREQATRTLQAVMARLLTSFPPGRVRLTIIDPVGLGENFAGFMHLADHDEVLVGPRIWTDAAHIEQRLTDLTDHMENVIQKYLRNDFESIDAYNEQAGELAEPYRFLIVANFPVQFNEQAARRLSSIVSSGARCGVYTLVAYDARQELPTGIEIDDVRARSLHVVHQGGRFVWQDDLFGQFPLNLDEPPGEGALTDLLHRVGEGAKASKRVEVPFEAIAPADDQCWTGDSSEDLRVPVGRSGATRLQDLWLGRGVAQHALLAGKTGSGKSTLLHVIVTNLALWYRPDEIEFYLVDFKRGVEFKTYVTHDLPHARAVAIESDREFGLSVLQRLDLEMERRGNLFREVGVQSLAAYRRAAGAALPRTLLVVDEFQIFFAEDDRLAQEAAILLDRLVRQGRAFGIHVVLGSQTLGGTSGLARSTIGQMAVRVALQCSEADSQLILGDDNSAARLLARPGEAIYNDAGGLVEGNSPFQTAWLSDSRRDEYLDQVTQLARNNPVSREPLIVFEGNAAARISENRGLAGLLDSPEWPSSAAPPRVWLGGPVAIKDPTGVSFRRQSGANLLFVGQRDDAAMAMMAAAMVNLAAQQDIQSARFILLDGTPGDSPLQGQLQRVAGLLPHETRIVDWHESAETIVKLASEMQRRQDAGHTDSPSVYVLIYALQRYRMLRHREDEFSFSSADEEKPPAAEKLFAELLREGPPVGIHVLTWSDTPASIERTLDRQSMREFDNRVLFQMSAADSSNLVDSPVANKLGLYRALLHSEEQGILEKFRPYAFPENDWLQRVGDQLKTKMATAIGSDGPA